MRIREGKLPACGIQQKKTNRENEERQGGQKKELCSKFLAVVPLFFSYDHRVFGMMHRTENEKLQRINDKMWDGFY